MILCPDENQIRMLKLRNLLSKVLLVVLLNVKFIFIVNTKKNVVSTVLYKYLPHYYSKQNVAAEEV